MGTYLENSEFGLGKKTSKLAAQTTMYPITAPRL